MNLSTGFNSGAPGVIAGPADRDALTALRERFINDPDHTDLSLLRPVIARSWRRSMLCNVSPAQKTMEAFAVPQLDEQVLRCAEPVLSELERLCMDTHGCVSLADPMGTIAVFRGEPAMVRWAERIFPTSGGRMSEELIGTNSDGTAIEEGGAVQVWGSEHFNDALQDSYCTSVPIRDPLRRSVRGVLSLSLPEQLAADLDPRSVLLIAQGAAAQITSALADRLAAREQALLAEYLREVRKRGAEAVIAMDDHTTIVNRGAMQMLDQGDYAVLAAYARDAAIVDRALDLEVHCSRERVLQLQMRSVGMQGAGAGTVMRLRPVTGSTRRSVGPTSGSREDSFKDLVGTSSALRRAIGIATTALEHHMSAYIVGEPGTGKRLLARSLAAGLTSAEGVCSFDLSGSEPLDLGAVSKAASDGQLIEIHNADLMEESACASLATLLGRPESPIMILTAQNVTDALLPLVSALRGVEIQMPPLRTHRDDIPLLIKHFLQRLEPERRPASRLVEALAAAEWPGNVGQLKQVVETAALQATGREVRLDDLTEVHRRLLARSRLSRLQKAELEQIREALVEAGGNRLRAASILRIGRSTLYRRIDFYTSRGFALDLQS